MRGGIFDLGGGYGLSVSVLSTEISGPRCSGTTLAIGLQGNALFRLLAHRLSGSLSDGNLHFPRCCTVIKQRSPLRSFEHRAASCSCIVRGFSLIGRTVVAGINSL